MWCIVTVRLPLRFQSWNASDYYCFHIFGQVLVLKFKICLRPFAMSYFGYAIMLGTAGSAAQMKLEFNPSHFIKWF